MEEHRKNGVDRVVACDDPDRSRRGAWLLDAVILIENQDFFPELDPEDPEYSRRLASYYQALGAIWDEHWFDRVQRFAPDIESLAFCPDITRSMGGAWMLPGNLPVENMVQDMKAEDASRSTADCFQILGGVWDEDHFMGGLARIQECIAEGRDPRGMMFSYLDPVRTHRKRVDIPDEGGRTGVEYTWSWMMTKRQKAAADRLKEEHPDWEWSRCYETVGGNWRPNYEFVTDYGGRTAEEIVALDEDQSLCAEYDRQQAYLQRQLDLLGTSPGPPQPSWSRARI